MGQHRAAAAVRAVVATGGASLRSRAALAASHPDGRLPRPRTSVPLERPDGAPPCRRYTIYVTRVRSRYCQVEA